MQFISNLWMRAKSSLALWGKVVGVLSFVTGPAGKLVGLAVAGIGLLTPATTVWSVLTSKVTWIALGALVILITGFVVVHNIEQRGADKVVEQTVKQQTIAHARSTKIETTVRRLPASAARSRLLNDWSVPG